MRKLLVLGLVMTAVVAACGDGEPGTLQERADDWAGAISAERWLDAYALADPASVEGRCSAAEFAAAMTTAFSVLRVGLDDSDALEYRTSRVEEDGDQGTVYGSLWANGVTSEEGEPLAWSRVDGEWLWVIDPDDAC